MRISEEKLQEFRSFSSRFDALVIGPGLTRSPKALENLALLLVNCQIRNAPLVIDADALCVIKEKHSELASAFHCIILTPNIRELVHLLQEVGDPYPMGCSLNWKIQCSLPKNWDQMSTSCAKGNRMFSYLDKVFICQYAGKSAPFVAVVVKEIYFPAFLGHSVHGHIPPHAQPCHLLCL